MGAEANIRGRIVKALARLHAVSIENAVDKGTPDVNTSVGWIELKQIDGFPRGPLVPVRVPKFTDEQRIWLRNRCAAGGNAWLLLRVGEEWFLLWGAWAADHLGDAPRALLAEKAVAHWLTGLDDVELCRELIQRGTRC